MKKDYLLFSKKTKAKFLCLFTAVMLVSTTLLSSVPLVNAEKTTETKSKYSAKEKEELYSYYDAQRKTTAEQNTKAFKEAAIAQLKARGLFSEEETEEQQLNSSKQIRVVVQLEKESAIEKIEATDNSEKTTKKLEKASEKIINSQQSIIKQVEKLTKSEVLRSFGVLLNGFSIQVKLSDIDKIRAIDGVASVTASRVFYPTDASANEMGNVTKVWNEQHLKGEGMVISIIDTGIDPSHKDLTLTSAQGISKDYVEQTAKSLGYGDFFTEKVPYGFNYADNNNTIVDTTGSMHGQHVAGISGANGDIQGVAPEAQLLAMKVFSNNPTLLGAYDDDIISAIEDSVLLGADIINMSLGSDSGFTDNNDPQQIAINRAAEAGVISVISAGNASVSTTNDTHTNPKNYFGTVDNSMLGSPGTTLEALTVASSENTNKTISSLKSPNVYFSGNEVLNGAADAGLQVQADYSPLSQPHEIVFVSLGFKEDYEQVDVKGKIALVQRGTISFAEKANNAKANGAAAVFIYNNVDAPMTSMLLDDTSYPTVGLSLKNGEEILEAMKQNQTFTFTIEQNIIENEEKEKMSTFSSWGPTPTLDFKPEITAPGGEIYSLANDNKYQTMSGTSMASPFVAGAEALVYQNLQKNTELSGIELVHFAKNALMNTSVPMLDVEHTKEIISPRRQGAGQIQVDKAISNTVSLTAKSDGKPSLALKEITQITTAEITLTNHGKQSVAYTFNDYGGVYTQATDAAAEIYDTKITGAAISTKEKSIILEPGQEKTLTISIELPADFQPNQFVEGYIGFDSETAPNLVIPYVGFYGNYQELPILDAPIYEETTISPTLSGFLYSDSGTSYLGLAGNIIDPNQIAISPNGDGSLDTATPYLYYLRNYSSAIYEIVDEKKELVTRLYEQKNGSKNYSSDGIWTATDVVQAIWDGTSYNTKNGKEEVVEDGQYYYKINIAQSSDSKRQTTYIPIKVDTTAPELQQIQLNQDGSLTIAAQDKYIGINESSAALSINGKNYIVPLKKVSDALYQTDSLAAILEAGQNKIQLVIADKAANKAFTEKVFSYGDHTDLLLFNLAENQTILSTDAFYSIEKGTYQINGSYLPDTTLFVNGQQTSTDKDGLFQLEIPVSDKTDTIIFSTDKNQEDILRTLPIMVKASLPTLSFKYEGETVSYTEKTYKLEGQTNAAFVAAVNQSTGMNYDLTSSLQEGQFSGEIPLSLGQNRLVISAKDTYGNTTTKMLLIETTDGQIFQKKLLAFDSLFIASPIEIVGAGHPSYNAENQTIEIKGQLNQLVDTFKLNDEAVAVDPKTLKFNYTLKNVRTGKLSLSVYISDEKLNNGKPIIDYGYTFYIDPVLPTVQLEDVVLENDQLKIYTNQNPYTINALIADNLSGYTLKINNSTVYQDDFYFTFDEKFFSDRETTVNYPVALSDGENILSLSLVDAVNNQLQEKIIVDYHLEILSKPTIAADKTTWTNQAVKLRAENTTDAPLYYSFDGVTWQEATEEVNVAQNSSIQFKFSDKYGNESEITTYEVTNIQNSIAATPVVTLSEYGPAKQPVTVTLGYSQDLGNAASYTHLRYSLDNGLTWQDYTAPFTVSQSTTVYAQTYDDAGNVSEILQAPVTIDNVSPTDPENTGNEQASDSSADNSKNPNLVITENSVNPANVTNTQTITSDPKENNLPTASSTSSPVTKPTGKNLPSTGELRHDIYAVLGAAFFLISFYLLKRRKVKES